MKYRYCYTCGGELAANEYVWSYNSLTGKPNIAYNYSCSGKHWYQWESHPMTESDAYALQ